MNREQMIEHMINSKTDVIDLSPYKRFHGWILEFGYFESYLAHEDASVGAIYQRDIEGLEL